MQPTPSNPLPAPPAKRKCAPVWLTIIMAVVILGCLAGTIAIIASAFGGGDKTGGGAAGSGDKTYGLNEPVRDGKFEFTVTKVDCGKATIGSEALGTRAAQGQFCIVTMNIKNIGTEARTYTDTSQIAYGPANVKYEADPTATIYLENANDYVGVNPGNSVTGMVVFDIPKGATIERLELHDSALSSGVTVTL